MLDLRERGECRWDLAALGEVMLRLDPGEGRIATTRTFRAWEGGGEYNVARGLRKCFGLRTTVVTALADNPVGRLVEDLILQGGVDTSHIRWVPYDGVGRAVRNGLNFTERGFGLRGAIAVRTVGTQPRPSYIPMRHRLGSGVRGRGRPLVPLRGYLRRALRDHRRRRGDCHGGGAAPWHGHLV